MTIRRIVASVLCSALFLAVAPAQVPGKPAGEKPAAAPQKPKPVFVIAKMGDKGDKLEVMTKEALADKNKMLGEEYAKAMKQYEKDKKAAEDAKKKFEGAEPKKSMVESVGGEFPTKEAADAAVKKMMDEKAKAAEKPKEPKKEKASDKPKHSSR